MKNLGIGVFSSYLVIYLDEYFRVKLRRWVTFYRYGVSSNPMSEKQDELKNLRSLEPQGLTAIHNHYYPEIYRFARYRLGDDVLAEDTASEVFVRLLEAVHNGRGPHTDLRGWLIGTTNNLVNDHYRKAYNRRIEELSEESLIDDTDPAGEAENKEIAGDVHSAYLKLTAEQQEVIALRFGGSYSLEETAKLMGKTLNSIKSMQFRALGSLRRHLKEFSQ
jgi:RNA polymerase sigma-70 factor (ECF subfamily)